MTPKDRFEKIFRITQELERFSAALRMLNPSPEGMIVILAETAERILEECEGT